MAKVIEVVFYGHTQVIFKERCPICGLLHFHGREGLVMIGDKSARVPHCPPEVMNGQGQTVQIKKPKSYTLRLVRKD